MIEIAKFEDEELDALILKLQDIAAERKERRVSSVAFAVDGGLKIKVVGHEFSSTWTPPMGRVIS